MNSNNNYIRRASLLIVEGYRIRSVVLTSGSHCIGRIASDNGDIEINSSIVSRKHGQFYYQNDSWYYRDLNSSNGTIVEGYYAYQDSRSFALQNGTVIKIDSRKNSAAYLDRNVLIYFCDDDLNQKWISHRLEFKTNNAEFIGRDQACDICLETVTVSRRHGVFYKTNGRFYYRDLNSSNGSFINGERVTAPVEVRSKDVMLIGNVKLIFIDGQLLFTRADSGGYLEIRGLTKIVKDAENPRNNKVILSDVSANIAAGKLVAVLGTSGAGKTTFLNCAIGYEEASRGSVLINGTDLYKHKKLMKRQIGYVPQEDLLRDGLSLESTLNYIGKLRLPNDVSSKERLEKIDSVLNMLSLDKSLKKSKIRKLSGGQRKRVSIASELISDPPLLFLDEPTSGLDPETETDLIVQLSQLAHSGGKTVIVITHTIKNIMMFDMILFFGPGGKLCYAGSPRDAVAEFKVSDFADIYPMVRTDTDKYAHICSSRMRRNNR